MITYNKHCLASVLNSIVSSVLSHWVLPHYAVVSAPFEKLRSRNLGHFDGYLLTFCSTSVCVLNGTFFVMPNLYFVHAIFCFRCFRHTDSSPRVIPCLFVAVLGGHLAHRPTMYSLFARFCLVSRDLLYRAAKATRKQPESTRETRFGSDEHLHVTTHRTAPGLILRRKGR